MIGPHKYIIEYKGKAYGRYVVQKPAALLLKFPKLYQGNDIEIYIVRS